MNQNFVKSIIGPCSLMLVLVHVGIAEPQPTPLLSLSDAIRLALENHPELRAAQARVDAATGREQQAGRWSNPELQFGVEEWVVSGGGSYSDSKQTIGIAQTLPFPGKKSLDREIAGAGVSLSEAEREFRRAIITRNVKAAYFQVLAKLRRVEVTTELVALAESSAATARKRVDAGAAAYQEQLRAEVLRDQAHTQLMEREREKADAQQLLATLIGRPEWSAPRLVGELAEWPDQSLLDPPPVSPWMGHPGLSAARANLDRAELEYRRSRLDTYPDVTVEVAGGRLGESDESIIELGLSLPLPILDRGQGRRQEARSNVDIAEAELHTVERELRREWIMAQKRYQTAAQQVTRYREQILPKTEEALRLIRTGFEEGKLGFIDLLDIQRTTAEVQMHYQTKLLEMNIAQAELEALLYESLPAISNPE